VAAVLRRTLLRGEQPPLLLELPDYRWPYWRTVLMGLWERAHIFITRAGTIILALMILIWAAGSYPAAPEGATEPAIYYSLAGMVGRTLAPLFAPLGFDWPMVVALIPGMMAREVAVAALGTVYALQEVSADTPETLIQLLSHSWTLPMALSYLVWFVYAPQCVATFGVMRRETNSWQWTAFGIVYLFVLAYAASALVYHLTAWVMA
jgi:ferrous iron transport protein B